VRLHTYLWQPHHLHKLQCARLSRVFTQEASHVTSEQQVGLNRKCFSFSEHDCDWRRHTVSWLQSMTDQLLKDGAPCRWQLRSLWTFTALHSNGRADFFVSVEGWPRHNIAVGSQALAVSEL